MRWTPWVIVILATAMAVHAIGCRTSAPDGSPPDPLLVSKKPQEGKIDEPAPVAVAPTPPAMPASVTADTTTVRLQRPDTQNQSARVPASTVSWSPSSKAIAPSRMGYGRDYVWLEGTVERAGKDRWLLRYAAPTGSDYWGGVVCLEPDARLAMLTEGATIRVEGGMVKEEGRVVVAAWMPYPRYQVKQLAVVGK